MKREIEVTATPKEVAELLFNLDNKEVAQVFTEWHKLFEDEYKRLRDNKEPIHIFDLSHFMMYVIKEMDDESIDLIRSMYSTVLLNVIDGVLDEYKAPLFIG